MIKITITGMTIEIPDEVGAIHGLLGAATKVTGAVNTPIKVATTAEAEAEATEEAEAVAVVVAADELAAKREAEEAAKAQARSEAAKKAAATKKAAAEAEAKAKAEADAKAAASAALEDDEAPASAYTAEQVKARFKELLDKNIDIIAILGKFGAAKLSALDPAKFDDVMAHVADM
jgi:ATPase subunit of ABC transporter with duplicated ATPase domains